MTFNDKRARMMKMLCSHCSRHAGANRYHAGPRGGGPNSACPYDTRGILRPGKNFIVSIYDTQVNALDIPDYRDIENEGLGYADAESLNQIQNGQALLNEAIPNYGDE